MMEAGNRGVVVVVGEEGVVGVEGEGGGVAEEGEEAGVEVVATILMMIMAIQWGITPSPKRKCLWQTFCKLKKIGRKFSFECQRQSYEYRVSIFLTVHPDIYH